MKKTLLAIDTTSAAETIVTLTVDDQEFALRRPRTVRKEQEVLQMAQELLTTQHLTPADITAITVNPGPGSFTGTRVGVTIANMLGFALGIPVNGQTSIEPVYQ